MQVRRRPGGAVAAEISREMVRLLSRYTGRGPTKARTTMDTNVIVVVFEDTLTKAERNLVAAGKADAVVDMRRMFHELIRSEACHLVEELSGRKVVSFLADADAPAGTAAIVFALERLPEVGSVYAGEAWIEEMQE